VDSYSYRRVKLPLLGTFRPLPRPTNSRPTFIPVPASTVQPFSLPVNTFLRSGTRKIVSFFRDFTIECDYVPGLPIVLPSFPRSRHWRITGAAKRAWSHDDPRLFPFGTNNLDKLSKSTNTTFPLFLTVGVRSPLFFYFFLVFSSDNWNIKFGWISTQPLYDPSLLRLNCLPFCTPRGIPNPIPFFERRSILWT